MRGPRNREVCPNQFQGLPESNLDAGAIRGAVDVRLFKSGLALATPSGAVDTRLAGE